MDTNEKYLYWLDIATYDLETANAMLASGRYLYVAFMCQQAIEKLSKGLYTLFIDDNVPRVHNISHIVMKFPDTITNEITEEHYLLFDRLTAFYMQGRYPSYKEKLSELLNEDEAKMLLGKTREVFACMQTWKL